MEYKKNCPGCNKEISYKTEKSLKRSLRKYTECRSCFMKKEFLPKEDAIIFYKNELTKNNKSLSYNNFIKLDKSNWPSNIPKKPQKVYKVKWSDITNNISSKDMSNSFVSKEEAIDFYRSEIKRQGISSIGNLNKSTWFSNIPKNPKRVYNMKWSEVTGNTYLTSNQTKQEIARLVLSYGPVFDTLDDTLMLIILSKLSDKKISSIIKKCVRKIVQKVIKKETPEERQEVLNEEVNKILNDEETDYSDDAEDVVDNDVQEDNEVVEDLSINIVETQQNKTTDVEKNLKRKINAIERALLSEDIDVDVKDLMRKNALKYMWYLEFYK